MKRLFFLNAFCLAIVANPQKTSAGNAEEFKISGMYDVKGKDSKGKKYEGSCLITGDASHGFQFNYSVGQEQFQGTGRLRGNTLTVDRGEASPIIYEILEGGWVLLAKWGPKGKGREKLTPVSTGLEF